MKPYAHRKTGHTTHPHNTCDICSGQAKSKKRTRQEVRREIINAEETFRCEYMLEVVDDGIKYNVCGECIYFKDGGCSTSLLENKYGSDSTPACTEFIKRSK